MRPRRRSLAEYLADEMPDEFRRENRPLDYDEARDWAERRTAWARAHGVNPLQLVRHDRDQLRQKMGWGRPTDLKQPIGDNDE